jgi:hypothetical protein
VSPAAAAAVIAERLQGAERALDQELAAIRRAAQARLAARHAARWRRLGIAVAVAGLAALAVWWGGWLAAAAVAALALAAVAVGRRRPDAARLQPQPTADTFEDVVQELGAIKAALQHRAATGEEVKRLLQAAEWLDRRGGELSAATGPPAGRLVPRSATFARLAESGTEELRARAVATGRRTRAPRSDNRE